MATDTKELILDAAERLFAENGIDAVSLRTIISEAGVNLAAIHYHYGSKDLLIKEVFGRRIRPVNRQRLMLLDECEARAGQGPLPIEDVLRAFFSPAIRLSHDKERGHIFMRLCGRFWSEVSVKMQAEFDDLFREVLGRFLAAFHRALPHLSRKEIFWRVHFAVGGMIHTMVDSERLARMSGGLCDPSDVEETIEQLVSYAAAGFNTPAPPSESSERSLSAERDGREMVSASSEGQS